MDDYERRMYERTKVFVCRDWTPLLDYFGVSASYEAPETTPEETVRLYYEGAKAETERTCQEIKRSTIARQECIRVQGTRCAVCGFESEETYGAPGIIHIHHLHPLPDGTERGTNPETDLVSVCPNCHAFVHSKAGNDPYTIEEVRLMLKPQRHQ